MSLYSATHGTALNHEKHKLQGHHPLCTIKGKAILEILPCGRAIVVKIHGVDIFLLRGLRLRKKQTSQFPI